MASRSFRPLSGALEKAVVTLFARVDIGASGAPTLDADQSLGVTSIARTAAGDYTLTLDDTYNRLLALQITHTDATDADFTTQLVSRTMNASGGATISFSTLTAGVATDPASGDELLIRLDLKNSGIK